MFALGKLEAVLIVAGVLGVVLLKKKLMEPGAALNAGAAVAHVVADAGAGVVIGIGDSLGIPRTDETECEKAMREGRSWDASFACPAGTWLKYMVN
ncbi:hypothetical protein [Pseudoduganella aquatica]|uniref:hypothetical protein n=1 Tax=Pseudoduganella aquatica TaxID=2660641 RepID=UPI001E3FAC5D|nr:hypothetical protein [Pseudoduganella aquatica]